MEEKKDPEEQKDQAELPLDEPSNPNEWGAHTLEELQKLQAEYKDPLEAVKEAVINDFELLKISSGKSTGQQLRSRYGSILLLRNIGSSRSASQSYAYSFPTIV